jgi:hypothetical protein
VESDNHDSPLHHLHTNNRFHIGYENTLYYDKSNPKKVGPSLIAAFFSVQAYFGLVASTSPSLPLGLDS